MKHEERNPMKLFKTLLSNASMFIMGVTALLIVMSIVGQVIMLGFYAAVLALIVGAVMYLFFRRTN
jgi:hypothetical protein